MAGKTLVIAKKTYSEFNVTISKKHKNKTILAQFRKELFGSAIIFGSVSQLLSLLIQSLT
jgi:hypothetical protein